MKTFPRKVFSQELEIIANNLINNFGLVDSFIFHFSSKIKCFSTVFWVPPLRLSRDSFFQEALRSICLPIENRSKQHCWAIFAKKICKIRSKYTVAPWRKHAPEYRAVWPRRARWSNWAFGRTETWADRTGRRRPSRFPPSSARNLQTNRLYSVKYTRSPVQSGKFSLTNLIHRPFLSDSPVCTHQPVFDVEQFIIACTCGKVRKPAFSQSSLDQNIIPVGCTGDHIFLTRKNEENSPLCTGCTELISGSSKFFSLRAQVWVPCEPASQTTKDNENYRRSDTKIPREQNINYRRLLKNLNQFIRVTIYTRVQVQA